jgi:hypothetical protein
MNEQELNDQEVIYQEAIRNQLFQVARKEYKDMKKRGVLDKYVREKSESMIDELQTILPKNPTKQEVSEANEIVFHHHIVEM